MPSPWDQTFSCPQDSCCFCSCFDDQTCLEAATFIITCTTHPCTTLEASCSGLPLHLVTTLISFRDATAAVIANLRPSIYRRSVYPTRTTPPCLPFSANNTSTYRTLASGSLRLDLSTGWGCGGSHRGKNGAAERRYRSDRSPPV